MAAVIPRKANALFQRMARPLRLEYSGALYHVTSRGNAKADIFLDDADRRIFLRILGSTVDRYRWVLHAFCLMGNHYHLLVETPQPNLSRGMQQVNGVYTQCFNRRHEHAGHVFQGRFGAVLVERESHLLELARYVALNPVRAGFVNSAAQWLWSSYRATAGLEAPPPWLTIRAVLEHFGPDPSRATARFEEFVQAGVRAGAPWSGLRGQIFLGSDQFVQRMQAALTPFAQTSEIPRADRLAARPRLASLSRRTSCSSSRGATPPSSQHIASMAIRWPRSQGTWGCITRRYPGLPRPPAMPQFKT